MCGIAGGFNINVDDKLLQCMQHYIAHRGPDDEGVWTENDAVCLIHTRLSVVDLSSSGKQPMLSPSGRYVLVFNGEIYNHQKIRKSLEKEAEINWRGHSDSEVLIAAIEHYGFRKAIEMCNGMFAVVVWDRDQKKMFLARDRMGEKPLYLGWSNKGGFLFSSEIAALANSGYFDNQINSDSLAWMLKLGYIPAPCSIYQGIYKLPAGCYIEISAISPGERVSINDFLKICVPYWDLFSVAKSNSEEEISAEVATEQLHQKLLAATEIRMQADVPLGAFLSGGIDSSLIVAMMQRLSSSPIQTFSIGFRESEFDESMYAEKIAEHLGTDHKTLFVESKHALNVVDKLPSIYQEPFADVSQIPTYLLCSLVKKHLTVALSGDGGDELFFGYDRYFQAMKMWKTVGVVPQWLRNGLASKARAIPMSKWNRAFEFAGNKSSMPGFRIHRFANRLSGSGVGEFHRKLRSHWLNEECLLVSSGNDGLPTSGRLNRLDLRDKAALMQLEDQLDYLPDDILVKLDRASMAVALETRIPFLDHDIVEFSWRIPSTLKRDRTQGKVILRNILSEYVPQSYFQRPKQGFGVPINTWLRGELRDWSESLLSQSALNASGLLNAEPIRNAWQQHLDGHDWSQGLWNILMFQSWLSNAGQNWRYQQ